VEPQPYGPEVTVRHLLTHTGGLPNPIPLAWVHSADQHDRFDESAALAGVLRRHARRISRPGARYRYSNIGYWLLGPLVARASGLPFVVYVRDHVLAPLGITPVELGYSVGSPADHAHGYLEKYSALNLLKGLFIDRALIGTYAGRWLHIRDHYLNGPAFGGLVGSAQGFAAFLQDQLRPRSALFREATRTIFYTRHTTPAGQSIPMTPGWHVMDRSAGPVFFKEGGGGGFHSMMRLYPSSGLGTVVIVNATSFDVRGLLDSIDAVLLRA
jgi:CubicO group peptidase (beta-lactamase class C family)